jgi:hypothetical protein
VLLSIGLLPAVRAHFAGSKTAHQSIHLFLSWRISRPLNR